MIADRITRTTSSNGDFISLVQLLDTELHSRYGASQAFYDQFNRVDQIKNVIILYSNEKPVGCGAFKMYSENCVEIKRMFVLGENRGKGYAFKILSELEQWAREMGYSSFVLETGINQTEAIRLYQRSGYKIIPNYGQYAGVSESICLKKISPG
jgi:putative acetyltransferase